MFAVFTASIFITASNLTAGWRSTIQGRNTSIFWTVFFFQSYWHSALTTAVDQTRCEKESQVSLYMCLRIPIWSKQCVGEGSWLISCLSTPHYIVWNIFPVICIFNQGKKHSKIRLGSGVCVCACTHMCVLRRGFSSSLLNKPLTVIFKRLSLTLYVNKK